MATPIGSNVVTSLARRYIVPDITDNVYKSNLLLFRLLAANKKVVRGGYQIELPLMYARFAAGGPYQGFDVLAVDPSDTVKNGAWDWKQYYVPVTVDGLTLIKTDSPEAVADLIKVYFAQAEMEMAEQLGVGLWSDGTSNTRQIDGIKGAVDDGSVLGTYAGLLRSANIWWKSQRDNTTATLDLTPMQTFFGQVTEGGRHPTIIVTTQVNYNRFWAKNQTNQSFPTQPQGQDEQLAQAGFTNLLFNGVPVAVDSHVPVVSGKDYMYFLNEDYMYFAVSPRADFYLEDFQTPTNQDAMTAKLLWAGNLMFSNCARQGVMSNLSA